MRACLVSRRSVFACCLMPLGLLAAVPATGQEVTPTQNIELRPLVLPAPKQHTQPLPPAPVRDARRPPVLIPLYASLIGLQALDIHSTRRAMDSGTTGEGNPLMRSFVENDAAFIAVKATTTASTIFLTERLRKTHPKAAVVLAASLNIAMAAVVARNYRLSRNR
jgi:hypothetical protein